MPTPTQGAGGETPAPFPWGLPVEALRPVEDWHPRHRARELVGSAPVLVAAALSGWVLVVLALVAMLAGWC